MHEMYGVQSEDENVDVDVVVLGLGIHGAAAVYELSSRGLKVIGIEQFDACHDRGSSHGATRMIRRAYPNKVWNGLVDDAFRGWARWERDAGRTFLTRTGGLYAHSGIGGMQGGRSRPVDNMEARILMPSAHLPEGYHAVYDPDAGVIKAAEALAYVHGAAEVRGAELSFGEQVESWQSHARHVAVTTDRRVIRTRKLVVAAGAWVSSLLPRYANKFEVWRIVTLSAMPGQDAGLPPMMGSFSVDLPEGLVFGVPETGNAGAKMGVDEGPVWDPNIPVGDATPQEIARLERMFAAFLPDVDLTGAEAAVCLYTMTPDKRFVLGEVPNEPNIVLTAACSGHGFKFGPAIGEAVADLVQGAARPDLEFLSPLRWELVS